MPDLTRFTRSDVPASQSWLDRVVGIGEWSVASDSRTLVAVRDGGPDIPGRDLFTASQLVPEATRAAIRGALDAEPPGPARRTTLPELWDWLGDHAREPCDLCGEWEDAGLSCDECGGKGWLILDNPRPVGVAGVLTDQDRLAWSLPTELYDFDPSPVLVAWRKPIVATKDNADYRILAFRAENWRVMVGGIDREKHPGPHRRYHFHPEYHQLHHAARRGDIAAQAAVADWLAERQLLRPHEPTPWGDIGYAAQEPVAEATA